MVHYVMNEGAGYAKHRPAVITEVFTPTIVNLVIFMDGSMDNLGPDWMRPPVIVAWRPSVQLDDTDKKAGTWHCPEYVSAVESS